MEKKTTAKVSHNWSRNKQSPNTLPLNGLNDYRGINELVHDNAM